MKYEKNFSEFSRRWDRFNAFHVYEGGDKYFAGVPFIRFETGELILDTYGDGPECRRVYPELHVELFSPRDSKHKLRRPTGENGEAGEAGGKGEACEAGEVIPKSWLIGKSAPLLLLDLDSGRVVRADRGGYGIRESQPKAYKEAQVRPAHLQETGVFYMSERAQPQGKLDIELSKPREKNAETKAFGEWLDELHRVCIAFENAREGAGSHRYIGRYWGVSSNKVEEAYKRGGSVTDVFSTLDEGTRAGIARYGIPMDRVKELVPYLELVR